MADAVASNVLLDGTRYYVVNLTNVSDGTGESAVVKVDVSAIGGAPSEVVLESVQWNCTGAMRFELYWDATANALAFAPPADSEGRRCWEAVGGLKNNAGSGKTGDLLLSTVGAGSGDTYDITLKLRKRA